jgi:hypothetical protein
MYGASPTAWRGLQCFACLERCNGTQLNTGRRAAAIGVSCVALHCLIAADKAVSGALWTPISLALVPQRNFPNNLLGR